MSYLLGDKRVAFLSKAVRVVIDRSDKRKYVQAILEDGSVWIVPLHYLEPDPDPHPDPDALRKTARLRLAERKGELAKLGLVDEFGEVSDITQMAFAKAAKLLAGEDELSV